MKNAVTKTKLFVTAIFYYIIISCLQLHLSAMNMQKKYRLMLQTDFRELFLRSLVQLY